MANKEYMLTTIDNPYDPFDDFDNWFRYDEFVLRHATCGLLDRIAVTSNDLPEEQNLLEIKRAMDKICDLFPGLYKTVSREIDSGGGS